MLLVNPSHPVIQLELTNSGYVITDTRRLLASLRKDHLLVPPPKRGSGTKRIVLDSSEEANACLRKKYFDPTSKIAHHVGDSLLIQALIIGS